MIKRAVTSVFAAFIAALLIIAPASADIKSFNAAVTAGNYKQAAIEAKAVWAGWDRQRPDTALIAREFGYVSYVAGDYAAARDFGQFLKDSGATLATPDDQPITSSVLLAVANFRLKQDDKTRTELLNALKQRQALPAVERLTVLAAEALYSADWRSGSYGNTVESADIATALLARGGAALTVRSLQARSFGAISNFMSGRHPSDFTLIADVHDAVVDALDAATNQTDRTQLRELKFTLQAWALSVQAYFAAAETIGTNIPKRVSDRELKVPAHALFPESTPRDQICTTTFDKGRIKYPNSAVYRGLIGTVILKIDVDHEGRITNPSVLASVPSAGFADDVLKAIGTAKFTRDKDAKPGCMMFTPSRVFTIVFQID